MKTKLILLICTLMVIAMTNCYANTESFFDNSSDIIAVNGQLDSSYANTDLTLMLVKKGVTGDEAGAADIAYLTQTKINSDGTYSFKFMTTVNPNDYQLVVNQNGETLTQSVKEAKTIGQFYKTDIKLDYMSDNTRVNVSVDNIFGRDDNIEYNAYIAFYDTDKNLIRVKKSDNTSIKNNGSFSVDTPETATAAKAFVWTSGVNIPIAKAEYKNEHMEFFDKGDGIKNTLAKLKNDKEINIVFVGGSITYGTGTSNPATDSYPSQLTEWLSSQYPDATINSYNAGVPSTGSRFACYRLNRDVLQYNPDLVIMMHSMNDMYCGESSENTALQVETEIREIIQHDPTTDIIAMFDTDCGQIDNSDNTYYAKDAEDIVFKHYNVPVIDVGRAVLVEKNIIIPAEERVDGAKVNETWNTYFSDGVHPNKNGYAAYVDVIKAFWEACSADIISTNAVYEKKLPTQLSPSLFGEVHYLVPGEGETGISDWVINSGLPMGVYPSAWCSDTKDSELSFTFTGTECGIYGFAFDETNAVANNFSYTIDGKEGTSGGTNFPVILGTNLENTTHTVVLKNTHAKTFIYSIMYR